MIPRHHIDQHLPLLVRARCPGPGPPAMPCGLVDLDCDDYELLDRFDGGPRIQPISAVCPVCDSRLEFCGHVSPDRIRVPNTLSPGAQGVQDEPDIPE